MRLAYFSPLSPIRSGIAAYSEELLPHLAQRAEVDLFVDDYAPTHPLISQRFPVFPLTPFGPNRWRYDAAIYHLGNHRCHEGIYRTALAYPGIVVLHDFNLFQLVGWWMTLGQGDRAGFMREMGYAQGYQGSQRAWRIVQGQEPVIESQHPLNRRALELCLGIIVHSDHARRLIEKLSLDAPVTKIEMGVPPTAAPTAAARAEAREALGIAPDTLLLASFGMITPAKRIESVLHALAELVKIRPHSHYALVGALSPNYDPRKTIRELGLQEHVSLPGFLPFDAYQTYMTACDVAVNLRYPTAGETSASVLRLLAAGLPTIVSAVDWFNELPDAVCRKVPPGEDEAASLYKVLAQLADDAQGRRELGQQAHDYVKRRHSLAGAAEGYVSFIQAILDDLRQERACGGRKKYV
jgi:glycosyltransferase involved in cell wall biosynthesis